MIAIRKLFYLVFMGLTITSCGSTNIEPIYPNKIDVDVTELNLKVGETKDVTCTISPSNYDYKSTNLKISGGDISGETYFTFTDKAKEGTTNVHIISITGVKANDTTELRLAINGEKEEIVKKVKVNIENVYIPPTTITPEKTEITVELETMPTVSYTFGPEGSSGECVKAMIDNEIVESRGVISGCLTDTDNKLITLIPGKAGTAKINFYSLLNPDDDKFTADKIKATITVTVIEAKN